jgi:hypothetical protein
MVAAWKSIGFRSYDAYIKSRLWWNIRQLILERDGRCCQVCGTPSKTIHHINYTEVILLGKGDQHELITLCEPCHSFVEQDKNLLKKKSLLNKLFTENSPSTLDSWQIWAKAFNTDICYNSSKILEPKNYKRKKLKKKKFDIVSDKIEKPIEEIKSESLRQEIDYHIKKYKKNKRYNKLLKSEDANSQYINDKVVYYNKLSEKQIKKQLHQAFPFFIDLLFNHPQANDKLKKCINPYLKKSRQKETKQQKRDRLEEQYQKQRERKKLKISSKLPNWTLNHKAKSFQGKSPLTKHISRVRGSDDSVENESS